MFVAFIDLFCCFALGNVVPEPFNEDFRTKLSRSPSFSSQISKASYPEHVAPMIIPSIL
jgi:hypothetical protein